MICYNVTNSFIIIYTYLVNKLIFIFLFIEINLSF